MRVFLLFITKAMNMVLGGSFQVTLSARAHSLRVRPHPYFFWTADVIDWLFFWDPGHCEKQWVKELLQRNQGTING